MTERPERRLSSSGGRFKGCMSLSESVDDLKNLFVGDLEGERCFVGEREDFERRSRFDCLELRRLEDLFSGDEEAEDVDVLSGTEVSRLRSGADFFRCDLLKMVAIGGIWC